MGDDPSILGAAPFLFVLLLSLLSALFIGYLYTHFYSDRMTGSQVYRAFGPGRPLAARPSQPLHWVPLRAAGASHSRARAPGVECRFLA